MTSQELKYNQDQIRKLSNFIEELIILTNGPLEGRRKPSYEARVSLNGHSYKANKDKQLGILFSRELDDGTYETIQFREAAKFMKQEFDTATKALEMAHAKHKLVTEKIDDYNSSMMEATDRLERAKAREQHFATEYFKLESSTKEKIEVIRKLKRRLSTEQAYTKQTQKIATISLIVASLTSFILGHVYS